MSQPGRGQAERGNLSPSGSSFWTPIKQTNSCCRLALPDGISGIARPSPWSSHSSDVDAKLPSFHFWSPREGLTGLSGGRFDSHFKGMSSLRLITPRADWGADARLWVEKEAVPSLALSVGKCICIPKAQRSNEKVYKPRNSPSWVLVPFWWT